MSWYYLTVALLFVATYAVLTKVSWAGRPAALVAQGRAALRAQAISEAQAAMLIIGALVVAGVVAAFSIFNTSNVKTCEANERAIETALNAYKTAVGSYPTAAGVTVTTYNGTTAGTFSNPTQISEDYLQQTPIDAANPTGSYSFSYTPPTGTTTDTYSITCPGVHSKGDLTQLPGAATATSGKIQLLSNQGFKAI